MNCRPKFATPTVLCRAVAIWFVCVLGAAQAAEPPDARLAARQAQQWATACMACHGGEGKAEGVGRVIGGRPAAELFEALLAFKRGERVGSVMPTLVRAFGADELKAIADVFGSIK